MGCSDTDPPEAEPPSTPKTALGGAIGGGSGNAHVDEHPSAMKLTSGAVGEKPPPAETTEAYEPSGATATSTGSTDCERTCCIVVPPSTESSMLVIWLLTIPKGPAAPSPYAFPECVGTFIELWPW